MCVIQDNGVKKSVHITNIGFFYETVIKLNQIKAPYTL